LTDQRTRRGGVGLLPPPNNASKKETLDELATVRGSGARARRVLPPPERSGGRSCAISIMPRSFFIAEITRLSIE
jgi:hypothetical protein